MNISYDKSSILQGNKIRQENEEQPVTFAEYNGASEALPSGSLDSQNQRMAGPVGARAMQLMNDPQARAATERWEGLFGQSNQGGEFNQEKMRQASERNMYLATNTELGKG